MDELKVEKLGNILVERCKCCLGDGQLKHMWEEYIADGRTEIYGDMLTECYDFTGDMDDLIDNQKDTDQICESCICRLRDALDFKREVLACAQLRYEHLHKGTVVDKKFDEIERELEKLESDRCSDLLEDYEHRTRCEGSETQAQNFEDVEYLEIDDYEIVEDIENTENLLHANQKNTKGIENIELEHEMDRSIKNEGSKRSKLVESKRKWSSNKTDDTIKDAQKTIKNINTVKMDTTDRSLESAELNDGELETQEPKRKWPKRRKKDERLKVYKQYTRQDMLNALTAVQEGRMSKRQASIHYSVPRKTLTVKLQEATLEKDDEDEEHQSKQEKTEKYFQFIEEVKKILTYTNAVPFKTKASRYFCAYCSTDGSHFEDPDDLRTHTRTKHVDDRTRNIEMVLRPQWQNEVIKLDIDSLHCTVCCTVIPTWSKMFAHLEDTHDIELDEAYTKAIPYILKRDLRCALCTESFPNYHHLDAHMNCHYPSYICEECGDTFLSASRFSKHVLVHNTGRYPCEECGRMFSLDKYRRQHVEHVHRQEHNVKCLYCSDKFYTTFQRHLHVVEMHKEKVKVTTCEMCGLRFEWKPYYIAHMRRKHNR